METNCNVYQKYSAIFFKYRFNIDEIQFHEIVIFISLDVGFSFVNMGRNF